MERGKGKGKGSFHLSSSVKVKSARRLWKSLYMKNSYLCELGFWCTRTYIN